jgi:hypothetical protein
MDPRITTPPEGLGQQFSFAMKMSDAMNRDFDALQEVKKLRDQLMALRERAGQGALADAIASLDKKAMELEGGSGGRGRRQAAGEESENLTRLNGELSELLDLIDSADATPTAQAVAAADHVERVLARLLSQWKGIKSGDVPALNEKLLAADWPIITWK